MELALHERQATMEGRVSVSANQRQRVVEMTAALNQVLRQAGSFSAAMGITLPTTEEAWAALLQALRFAVWRDQRSLSVNLGL